jgi:hypothetical protein
MLKKILKLLSLYQAARHGHRYGPSYKPWKRRKWKGYKHDRYGSHGYPPYPPPPGYGLDHGPYGYGRPRGLKGAIIDAIVHKLLKHR